jgi:hypothetical protein
MRTSSDGRLSPTSKTASRDGFRRFNLITRRFVTAFGERRNSRGDQWDGVAAVRGPKHEPGVLLVEAKSHPAEVLSTASAKHHESKAMIMRALAETKRYLGVDERQDWTSPYYQMANRLAFLYFLRERQKIPAWLVFLYFVGDQFWSRNRLIVGPTTPDEWEPHISAAYDGLRLKRANPLSPFVLHTFLPAVCKTANS